MSSIKYQNGIGAPLLLNQPSVEFESFAKIAEKEEKNQRNSLLEAGTFDGQTGVNQNYDWDDE